MTHQPESLSFGDIRFDCVGAAMPQSTPTHFGLRKTPWMAQRYADIAAQVPTARVVELGIDQGASTAFFSCLWPAGRLIAFDLRTQPSAALQGFLSSNGTHGRVKACWGVDQADTASITKAIRDFMGSEPLDVVVDDASHRYGPTLSSFEALFPLLRPGGVYVIEDWAWELQLQRGLAAKVSSGDPEVIRRIGDAPEPTEVPMARIVPALALLAGGRSDVIADMTVRGAWVELRRGPADLARPLCVADEIARVGERTLATP